MFIILSGKIEELLKEKHSSRVLPLPSSSHLPENKHNVPLSENFGFPLPEPPQLETHMSGPIRPYANKIEIARASNTLFPVVPANSSNSQSNSTGLAFREYFPSGDTIRAL